MVVFIDTLDDILKALKVARKEYGDEIADEDNGPFDHVIEVIARLAKAHPAMVKKCRKCLEVYVEAPKHFDRNLNCKDGLRHECKHCRRLYANKFKKLRREEARFAPGDLEEINRMREAEGQAPIAFPSRRRGRPRKGPTELEKALEVQRSGLKGDHSL